MSKIHTNTKSRLFAHEKTSAVSGDSSNADLADRYRALAAPEIRVILGGRLAEYRYYDMAPVIERVLNHPEVKAW
ncbi:MAG: hypothetical protein IJN29_06030 [Akkermansia sp.]|nr:hypothetical protein [Akkermansia sp.]